MGSEIAPPLYISPWVLGQSGLFELHLSTFNHETFCNDYFLVKSVLFLD